jgi:ABC-2 type transport system permease protein
MSAVIHTTPEARAPRPFAELVRTELKLFRREPVALFWGIAFPLILLVVLGSAVSDKPQKNLGGLRFIDAYVPVLIVFILAILALNAVPSVLTSYRDKGYLRRLSTTPVGAPRLLGAQFVINLGSTACAVAVTLVVARLAFRVALPGQVVGFLLTVALAAAAMLALGALVSALAPNQRLAGLFGSLLTFPMMFFAGLWVPRQQMGATLRQVGDFTPLGAASGAVHDAMAGHWPHVSHLWVLAAYAVIFSFAAARLFRWEK